MSAYWVVRVAVRDADKLTAYAPLAAATVETMRATRLKIETPPVRRVVARGTCVFPFGFCW